jgi:hypothetical protein
MNKVLCAFQGLNRKLVLSQWIILFILTIVLVVYPVNLSSEYHPIQAPYLFDNLWLFGSFFCIWFVLLIFLILTVRHKGFSWQAITLITVFSIVFVSFWIFITPYGSYVDGLSNMGHVRNIIDNGKLVLDNPNFGYFDFPGLHLVTSAFVQVLGLSIFQSCLLFLVLNVIIFAISLYLVFFKLLNSNWISIMGVMLALFVSTTIIDDITEFYPRALGFTFLGLVLLIISRNLDSSSTTFTLYNKIILIILLLVTVISYFPVSLLLFLIFVVTYLLQRFKSRFTFTSLTITLLLLCFILCWDIYWTWHTFASFNGLIINLKKTLIEGDYLQSFITLFSANAGGNIPLWANITNFLWWGLLLSSTILGISRLLRIRSLDQPELLEIGGVIGVILLTIIGIIGTPGGGQIFRYLLYSPIFCIPILLNFLNKQHHVNFSMPVLVVITLLLAFPTFLSCANNVSTDAIHNYEISVGEFFELNSLENGKNTTIFALSSASKAFARYYIPEFDSRTVEYDYNSESNRNIIDQRVQSLIDIFLRLSKNDNKSNYFIIDSRSKVIYEHLLNIQTNDPMWKELEEKASERNLIYNNNKIEIFSVN